MPKIQARIRSVVLHEGQFIRVMARDGWEYVERTNCTGIVIILAMTKAREVIFIEQYRIPVDKRVIEFPAGLINDIRSNSRETFLTAAYRELWEETGYRAAKIEKLVEGPMSSGLCSDQIIICWASGLQKVSAGGGDGTESITVHEISLGRVESWLEDKKKKGCLVDPKIYMGLYFLRKKIFGKKL